VLAALAHFSIKGMAHITGGGIPGNLIRVLPKNACAMIDRNSLPTLEIFETIRRAARIERAEMDRTFNCGVGYCMVVARKEADALCAFLRRRKIDASIIGEIRAGRRSVRYRESS
jgi:phosphoribosylformylglycinamidine cyclo-ligase